MRIIRNNDDIALGLQELVALDPRLALIADKAGSVPLRLQKPGYAGLADIVVSQMVSKASAAAIWMRLSNLLGADFTAEAIVQQSEASLRSAGLSGAKEATLRRIAHAVLDGSLDLDAICKKDGSEAIRELTAIKGVGHWTAEVYLMFAAGHPDVFPVGDVALQAAVAHAFAHPERMRQKQLAEFAKNWSPWRSVAARLFWAYYSVEMRRSVLPVPDVEQN